MGRRTRVGSRTDHGQDPVLEDSTRDVDRSFPLAIAGLSTVAALALFFTGTIPALQEQRVLREVEVERQQLHKHLWTELDEAATQRMALAVDLQSLLVELDRQGVYAGDLLGPPSAAERPAREGGTPR